MKKTSTLILCLLISLAGKAASAAQLTDNQLLQIRFDQRISNQIPRDLVFRDETGNAVKLAELFHGRPVILVLGYYECPMLCTITLNGLIEAMQDLKMDVGRNFDIINVSIDPKETPKLAAAKKHTYLKQYGRHGAEAGWHFLTGEDPAIHELTDAAGFHYAYDPVAKQFAHPSGVVILTPDGRISRYLFGVTYSPEELNTALRAAGAGETGSPVRQFFLLCFHYSPLTGKYGNLIMTVVRITGVLTMAALAFVVIRAGFSRSRGGPA